MDAFRLRRTVVADNAEYIKSFLTILDPQIGQLADATIIGIPRPKNVKSAAASPYVLRFTFYRNGDEHIK